MQARPTAALPHGPEWRYEIKWDGFRILALKENKRVRLLSRNEHDLTARFPAVADQINRLNARSVLLDGELVGIDATGMPSFQALTTRKHAAAALFAFDLLHLDGADLRSLALEQRKAALRALVINSGVHAPEELRGPPDALAREARKLRLEGIVAKRRDSLYVSGDSSAWLKFKLRHCQEFVIGGYVPPMRALVVGCYERGALHFVSQVYAGLDRWSRAELTKLLHPLTTAACPFANLPMSHRVQFDEGIRAADMAAFRWVRPVTIAQLEFQEWTRAGLLRHSRFLSLREDKSPSDCTRE